MTNYEWLVKNNEELIKDVITHKRCIGKQNGTPTLCGLIECGSCDFSMCNNNHGLSCTTNAKEWLEAEYEPLYKKGDIVVDRFNKILIIKEDDCGEKSITISSQYDCLGCGVPVPTTDIKKKIGHIDEEVKE